MENFDQKEVTPEVTVHEPANQVVNSSDTEVMSLGDWMLTIFITAIPVVGLVMLFVWAFGKGENESKKNWAKANLIWMAIAIVLFFIFIGSILSSLSSALIG